MQVPRLRIFFLTLAITVAARADTILTIAPGGSATALGANASSWTSTVGFTAVTIVVNVGTLNASTPNVSAYLMTHIGPGTTTAQQVAATTFVAPTVVNFFNPPPATTVFTGLSLPPGTYYLVLSSTSGSAAWEQNSGAVITGTGVTFAGDHSAVPASFPPASSFSANAQIFAVQVTGTPAVLPSTPAPPSLLLTLSGLAAAGLVLARKKWARPA